MAKTGIGLLDQGFEALEEGAKQAVQGVGPQARWVLIQSIVFPSFSN